MSKFCVKCGHEINNEGAFCPNCGHPVGETINVNDKIDSSLNGIAFIFPLIGIIMFLIHVGNYPNKAKCILKYSLVGFVLWFSLFLIIQPRIGIRIIPIY